MTPTETRDLADSTRAPSNINPNSVDLTITMDHTAGEKLAGYFSGLGGSTRWGVAWFDGRAPVAPDIATFDTIQEALAFLKMVREGELQRVHEALNRRILELAEMEAAKLNSSRETEEEAKARRLAKIRAAGAGSSRPSNSSETSSTTPSINIRETYLDR